jgi:hypothetical protein
MKCLQCFIYGAAVFVVVVMLFGCASSGLYAMSDEWCAAHPDASPARCDRNPGKHYDPQGHMPPVVYGDACPGRYNYGAYGVTITCWGSK